MSTGEIFLKCQIKFKFVFYKCFNVTYYDFIPAGIVFPWILLAHPAKYWSTETVKLTFEIESQNGLPLSKDSKLAKWILCLFISSANLYIIWLRADESIVRHSESGWNAVFAALTAKSISAYIKISHLIIILFIFYKNTKIHENMMLIIHKLITKELSQNI